MIGTGRRINDFDNFINANPAGKMHSPRNLPLNLNNFNTLPSNPNIEKPNRCLSPNRISNTNKPMITPSRSPRNPTQRLKGKIQNEGSRDYYCPNQNHPPRKADFSIKVQGIDKFYCEVCAAHAASQGFTVKRIANIANKKQKAVPHYPQYSNNKRYLQITHFMNNVLELQTEYRKIQSKKGREHYQLQTQLLNTFYDDLNSVIQKMREDHLADLMAECEENAMREAMQLQNLKMHLDELNQSWEDIEHNVKQIVEDIDHENYQQCMEKYIKDMRVVSHKLQEFHEQKHNYTTYSQNSLNRKIKSFESKLLEIWDEDSNVNVHPVQKMQPESKRPVSHSNYQSNMGTTTLRNVHEMLPKTTVHQNGQGQGPFRNLFPQQQEERLPEASPQFKAF